jgi:hypothetical protein
MSTDICAALERLMNTVHDLRLEGGNAELRVALNAARAALAEPVGEGPTDQELNQEWQQLMNAPEAILAEPMLAFARAVLARWGTPAAPPAPEVVAALKVIDKMQQEWVLIGNDDDGTASPSLSMPISLRRFTVLRDAITQPFPFSHPSRWPAPAPAVVPIPVAERLPGEGDCDAEGRCWIFMPDIGTDPSWRLVDPRDIGRYHTHWLPAHAIPLPQAGEGEA